MNKELTELAREYKIPKRHLFDDNLSTVLKNYQSAESCLSIMIDTKKRDEVMNEIVNGYKKDFGINKEQFYNLFDVYKNE